MVKTDIAITITDLTVQYGRQTVLENFSMSVAAGQTVVLSGPSGCGKSTVLKCLLGLVRPTGGEIKIMGQTLTAETVWALRRSLAYVPQEPDLGTETVRAVLEQPFAYHANRVQSSVLDTLPQWMERVDLPASVLEKPVTELSGGEKQRVALVGAWLLDRPIVLLDEASAALDEAREQRVIELLRTTEKTLVIVTHAPERFGFADEVIRLDV